MDTNEKIIWNLNDAVGTMRAACEEADWAIACGSTEFAVQQVLHSLAWGFANASTGIERAMAIIEESHEK